MPMKKSRKSKKNQKIYKMKGCSKKTCKNYLGGSASNINLAYPGNVPTVPNPFLAYTGKKGGAANVEHSLAIPLNTNAIDKTLPNTGPINKGPGTPFLNPQGAQRGGACGTCGIPFLKGGCGPLCAAGFMVGGEKHRSHCRCSDCKMMGGEEEKVMMGGNVGIPYPNGLVGSPWTPSSNGLPGVNGIQGDNNYIAPNNYHSDVQTAIISTGAQPPFSIGGRKHRKSKQRGGSFSNFMGQDLINLGRQINYGFGSAYNALAGYSAPTNPLPWKGQLVNTSNINTIRAASI